MDEDLWMDDGLEELFLLIPGDFAIATSAWWDAPAPIRPNRDEEILLF
jgi:hypothetical protein